MKAVAEPSAEPLSRRERKKERTRQEIYRAAMALFGERGYDTVSIEAICEAADVARGTFFLHFPTKSALLSEFDRSMAAEFSERSRKPPTSATDELRSLCELLSARWIADAEIMGAMLREFIATGAVTPPSRDGTLDLPELIEGIVVRGQASGEFRAGLNPRLAVAIFLSTSAAILSGAVFSDAEATPEQVREQFLEVVLNGLVTN